MAKKAKKGRTKKAAGVAPTYMTGKRPLRIGLHDVIRALQVIEEHGQLDRFAAAAKRAKAKVSIASETVNFVKDFMVRKQMHEHPIGRHIVNARAAGPEAAPRRGTPKDPFECSFAKD